MWWQRLLSAIGVVWDVLRCVACGVEVLVRKKDIAPPGWVTRGAEWLCPECASKEDIDACVKDRTCWDDV